MGVSKEVIDQVSDNTLYPQLSNCLIECLGGVTRRFSDTLQTVQRSLIYCITAVTFAFEATMQQSQNEDLQERLSDGVCYD